MARSNSLNFPIREAPPLQETGWEVRVFPYARTVPYDAVVGDDFDTKRPNKAKNNEWGDPIFIVPWFVEVMISPEINAVGQGSITLDLDAEYWSGTLENKKPVSYILEHEHLWQVFEGENLRFEFFGQQIEETFLDSSETRAVVVSGPGPADCLRWARVLTKRFPQPPKQAELGQGLEKIYFVNHGNTNPKSWQLTGAATKTLDLLIKDSKRGLSYSAGEVTESQLSFDLTGYVANIPTYVNPDIGRYRAEAARDYMKSHGLPKATYVVHNGGKSVQVAPNYFADGKINPDGVAHNDRVEINYTKWVAPTTSDRYQFSNVSTMAAYKVLLEAAQNRGTIGFVVMDFTADKDSCSTPWVDNPPPPPPPTPQPVPKKYTGETYLWFQPATAILYADARDKINAMAKDMYGDNPDVTIYGHKAHYETGDDGRAVTNLGLLRAEKVGLQILTVKPGAKIKYVDKSFTESNTKACPHPKLYRSYPGWPYPPGQPSGRGTSLSDGYHGERSCDKYDRRVTIEYSYLEKPKDPSGGTTPAASTQNLESFEAPLGINLLDLLNEWSNYDIDNPYPIRFDWFMKPGFHLQVCKSMGQDKCPLVVFYDGSVTAQSKSRRRTRESINNYIAIMSDMGKWFLSPDKDSMDNWRRREYFENPQGNYVDSALQLLADNVRDRDKYESTSWTLEVPAYADERRVFWDYDVGDWIGVSRFNGDKTDEIDKFRVMAITARIDMNSDVTVELKLQSVEELYLQQLGDRIASILNHKKKAPEVFVQLAEPLKAKTGDLWTSPFSAF